MGTKQRIIDQAIAHYNAYGVTNVTSRDLAAALGISHGNLEYHFKTKGHLLKAIYQQMRADISSVYAQRDPSVDPFLHFNELLERLEAFHNKYLFFNLDVLEISRNFKEVNALLRKTFQIRHEQTAFLFRRFIGSGYLKEERVEGMYGRLQHTIRILITFWKSQQEVLPASLPGTKQHMAVHIWELLVPHMTAKGLRVYRKYIEK